MGQTPVSDITAAEIKQALAFTAADTGVRLSVTCMGFVLVWSGLAKGTRPGSSQSFCASCVLQLTDHISHD